MFPIKKLTLNSTLDALQMQAKLESFIETKISIFSEKEYEGRYDAHSFKIEKNTSFHSTFFPVILGKMNFSASGCKIYVEMKLDVYIKVFLTLCYGLLVFLLMVLLKNSITAGQFNLQFLIPLFFSTLLYFFTKTLFDIECQKAIKYLDEILRK